METFIPTPNASFEHEVETPKLLISFKLNNNYREKCYALVKLNEINMETRLFPTFLYFPTQA